MAEEMAAMDRTQQRAAMMAAAGLVRDYDAAAQRLGGWLEGRLGAEVVVSNLRVPTGAGLANETMLFEAAYTEDGQRKSIGLVARVKPFAVVLFPDPDFDGLVRLFQTLGASGHVKVPKVYWLEQDPSILGAPFFIMEQLKARTPVSQPPYTASGWLAEATPEQQRIAWTTAVEGLASVHNTPGELVSFIGWPKYGPTGEDQQLGYWEDYGRWIQLPLPDEVVALGEWVRKNRPNDPGIHLSWGDARIGNMMIDDNFDVVAVMDWEQPSLGGALQDLAWWLRLSDMMHSQPKLLDGMGTREETIALWHEITGVSTDDIEWYESFASVKLAILSVQMSVLKKAPLPTEAWPDNPIFRGLADRLGIAWGG